MTPVFPLKCAAVLGFLAATLAGCANTSHSSAGHDHGTDPQAMCEHHRQMAASPDHTAMMQEHMKGMSSEQMQQHMQTMQEKCK